MEILKRNLHQPYSRPISRSPSPCPVDSLPSYRNLTPSPPPRPRTPPSPPVPTSPVAPTSPEPPGPLPLLPCGVCGRTFLPDSLAKHAKICEKMAVKKRKAFDSSRQRREGTDLEQYLPKNFGLPENSPFAEKSPPAANTKTPARKAQSVRGAVSKAAVELSRCQHCGRGFNVRAFERHVEWCAEKAKILPAAGQTNTPQFVEAKTRLNARTQYRAPPPVRSRRSLTRDKCSLSRSTSVESSVRGASPADPRRPRAADSTRSSAERLHEPHAPLIRHRGSGDHPDARARQQRLARDLGATMSKHEYDPFASAARQMRELMSSDTNIPKRDQAMPKDPAKTLPYLRNSKEKSPPFYARAAPNYSKTMKETINRNTQNTPSLQRMRSFGSNSSDYGCVNTFGSRASSFRVSNKTTEKKSSPKINSSFTKTSKESVCTQDRSSPFSRTSSLNKSFSSYSGSYSTNRTNSIPKPVMSSSLHSTTNSLHHSIQRTVKPPKKLEKITNPPTRKEFVNLDTILADDNSSTTDGHYIDPRLINENDNLPINVNTILNNPGMISSMESLLNTENLPSKFETFRVSDNRDETNNNHDTNSIINKEKNHTNNNSPVDNKTKSLSSSLPTPTVDDLSIQYDKIMTSLEQSIATKVSVRDDDSLCEDFDLEEFMISFDEELKKQRSASQKRSYSSTTRVVKNFDISNRTPDFNSISSSPKVKPERNGLIPINKSSSMSFSNNMNTLPSSFKRSISLLDSLPKTTTQNRKKGYKTEEIRLEEDIIKSLKEFEQVENWIKKEAPPQPRSRRLSEKSDTMKKLSRTRENKPKYDEENDLTTHNSSSNGKISYDSAYSSLNRISPAKLTVCNSKEATKIDRVTPTPPLGSDSGGSHKEQLRPGSSDEFLALERSAELADQPLERGRASLDKEIESYKMDLEKRASDLHRSPPWRSRLSSSSSDCSLPRAPADAMTASATARLSRFCHECGARFHVHTAKFCTECGAKRLSII